MIPSAGEAAEKQLAEIRDWFVIDSVLFPALIPDRRSLFSAF